MPNENATTPVQTPWRPVAAHCSDEEFVRKFAWTELGHAKRFIRLYGKQFRYCAEFKSWICWTGTHWQFDTEGAAIRAAKTLGSRWRSAILELNPNAEGKELAELLAPAKWLESRRGLESLLALASTEQGVSVSASSLDSNPHLLNLKNGTLDLQEFDLVPHRQEDLITKILDVDLDFSAACPCWDSTLNRIFRSNPDAIPFLRRIAGYSLTGSTKEQVFFLFQGSGANGKTTVATTLLNLLGPYAQATPMETLMKGQNSSIPNDVARLRGARLAVASECEGSQTLSEAKLKQLTGQDRLIARFLYKDFFEFDPTHKLVMLVNQLPEIAQGGHALWRRALVVPFMETILPEEQDKDLMERLRGERAGILRWCLEGYAEWAAQGLQPPPSVLTASTTYREEMDNVSGFLEAECEVGSGLEVSKASLFESYVAWCERNAEISVDTRIFSRRIQERGFKEHRTARQRRWQGLRLNGQARVLSLHPDSFQAPPLRLRGTRSR